MAIYLLVLGAATALLIAAWMAVETGPHSENRGVRRALRLGTAVVVDGWLWAIAFDGIFGPQHWLIGLLAIGHLLLGMGAVQGVTGYRARSDGGFARAGGLLGGRDGMRMAGFDDHRPYR